MGLNSTPASERVHIGFFGIRNAGKSSLVNRITNQDMSVVSDVKGTTTDAVKKSMELLPVGAVVIIDTPGFDDEGELGEKRVESARKILSSCNVAILVTENEKLNSDELELLKLIKNRDIPYLIVHNKSDLTGSNEGKLYVSTVTGEGIEKLKEEIARITGTLGKEIHFVSDFIKSGDTVIASGAIRMEGTSKEYAPIEYPAVPDFDVLCAMREAARNMHIPYHVGVVECKDAFYGQHHPESMPVSYELQNKWEAWLRMGCLASEMESAALFIAGAFRRVRVGSLFLVMANQERAKRGLDNPVVHDIDQPIRTAIEAIRILIREDAGK